MNGQPTAPPPPPPPQQPQQPQPQPPQAPAGGTAPQGGVRVLLYIVSFLIPLVGIILGIVYMVKPDQDSKKFGKMCLILGIVSIVIGIVLAIVVNAVVFTAVTSTVPYYY